MSDESGILSPMSSSSMGNIQQAAAESAAAAAAAAAQVAAQSPVPSGNTCSKVRFRLTEDEAVSSSNPSDSNNSTSTDSGAHGSSNINANTSILQLSSSAVAAPHPAANRQTSTVSLGSSVGSSPALLGQVSERGDKSLSSLSVPKRIEAYFEKCRPRAYLRYRTRNLPNSYLNLNLSKFHHFSVELTRSVMCLAGIAGFRLL